MEASLERSRSIIVNKTHSKFQQKRYESHKEAVSKVRGTLSCY